MAQYDRLAVYNAILASGLVPLFYNDEVEVSLNVARACAEGGARVLEFTNRGDRALPVFVALNEAIQKESIPLILGVGSVIDAPTAALYIAHGANFVVGPMLNADIARLCNRRKIAYMPGCGSVSEISEAEELGVEIVKVFPGTAVGGPEFVRDVLAPMPWTRIMPTGGVDATEESLGAWFKAGVAAVGMGSKLIRKDLIAAQDYAAIAETVRSVLAIIARLRGL